MKSIDVKALWQKAIARMDTQKWEQLRSERPVSQPCCEWIEANYLMGCHKDGWAFAVYDATGNIVSIHYRTPSGWKYDPPGQSVHPMIIRGTAELTSCHDYESQWDALAIISKLELYRRDDLLHIITRGSENGGLIAEVPIPPIPVYLWGQDDGMSEKHRNTPLEDRPSQHWINGTKAAHNGVKELRVVQPPIGYKDWCDYTRNGATAESIWELAAKAQPEPPAEPDIEVPPEDSEDDVPIVRDFRIGSLAPIQREMVEATAESIGVHPNLPAVASLGVVAAAIGRGLYSKSGPNQVIHANVFIVGSAVSGEGKSEGCRPMVSPFIQENLERIKFYKEVQWPSYASQRGLAKKEIASIESVLYGRKKNTLSPAEKKTLLDRHEALTAKLGELDDKLIEPAMLTEDCTQEMMALLMQHNNQQLFSFSADAAKAIYNLEGLYNKTKSPEDNLMVHSYSGDPCSIHRISRPAINLEHPCLTLLWFLQPDLFTRMLANERLREGGFLVRILPCDTRMEPRESDGNAKPIPAKLQEEYAELIRSLIQTYWDSNGAREIVVSADQEKEFRTYRNSTVEARKGKLRDINSFVARWPEQARRLAIGQHVARYGKESHLNPMADATVENAIRITEWFADEQLRMLQSSRQDVLRRQMEELHDLLLTKYPQGVSLRTLDNNHNKSEELVERIVQNFPAFFVIEEYRPPGGGRPSRRLFRKKTHR